MTLEEKIAAAVALLQSTPWDEYWTVERATRRIANYHGPDGAEGERAAWFRARFEVRLQTMTVAELCEWLDLGTRHDRSRDRRGGSR